MRRSQPRLRPPRTASLWAAASLLCLCGGAQEARATSFPFFAGELLGPALAVGPDDTAWLAGYSRASGDVWLVSRTADGVISAPRRILRGARGRSHYRLVVLPERGGMTLLATYGAAGMNINEPGPAAIIAINCTATRCDPSRTLGRTSEHTADVELRGVRERNGRVIALWTELDDGNGSDPAPRWARADSPGPSHAFPKTARLNAAAADPAGGVTVILDERDSARLISGRLRERVRLPARMRRHFFALARAGSDLVLASRGGGGYSDSYYGFGALSVAVRPKGARRFPAGQIVDGGKARQMALAGSTTGRAVLTYAHRAASFKGYTLRASLREPDGRFGPAVDLATGLSALEERYPAGAAVVDGDGRTGVFGPSAGIFLAAAGSPFGPLPTGRTGYLTSPIAAGPHTIVTAVSDEAGTTGDTW